MEYYIYVTKSCNLACDYCSGVGISSSKDEKYKPVQVDRIVEYVTSDILSTSHEDNLIVFYGGEPLLNQSDTEMIMRQISSNIDNVRFAIYTNGVLLGRLEKYLLDNLDFIFISLDGDSRTHNRHRGKGTFEKTLQGFSSIRNRTGAETMARITVTDDLCIDGAVLALGDRFDHVFWSLVSTNKALRQTEATDILERYGRGVKRLLDFWVADLQRGSVKNWIPLQSIASSLLRGNTYDAPRCNCDSFLRVIDIDNRVYICDEFLGDKRFERVNGTYPGKNLLHEAIANTCHGCRYFSLCGGRCAKALMFDHPSRRDLDCQRTIVLIDAIQSALPKLRSIIEKGIISMENLETYVSLHCTEEIP